MRSTLFVVEGVDLIRHFKGLLKRPEWIIVILNLRPGTPSKMPLACLSSRGAVYDLSGSGSSERWTSKNKY